MHTKDLIFFKKMGAIPRLQRDLNVSYFANKLLKEVAIKTKIDICKS